MDGHLADVSWQGDRQLAAGVGDPEEGVGDRGCLVGPPS
jgi:hypothetical protein